MSYLVFARKYRPQNFDEVAGQEAVATTLKNAIESERVAHAYLFCGPRGVGKTSMARIFSKALNCESGPTTTPCNECGICTSISTGEDLDVMELDGATNRGIDEIRQIRDNVRYTSNRAKFKIYIIDEVHMLTKEAFNALLKTLEEPPPHVKFIFATTEVHRIPETILSRCQRFDFRRITTEAIVGRLQQICDAEGVKTTKDVLHGVAKSARGAMRDSQSLLDKLISFGHKDLTLDLLQEIQGAHSFDEIAGYADLLIGKRAGDALLALDRVLERGGDLGEFMNQLIEHLRMMMILQVSGDETPLLDVTVDELERLRQQARPLSVDSLLYMIRLLTEAQNQMKFSSNTRIPIEVAVVKLAQMEDLRPIGDVLKRLVELEQSLKSVPQAPQGAPPGPSGIQPAPVQAPPIKPESGTSQRQATATSPAPLPSQPIPPAQDAPASAPPAPSPAVAVAPPPQSGPPSQIAARQVNWTDVWPRVVEQVNQQDEMLASYLKAAHLLGEGDGILKLGFLPSDVFKLKRLETNDNRKVIESCLEQISGQSFRAQPVSMEDGAQSDLLAPLLGSNGGKSAETDKPEEPAPFNPGDLEQHPTLGRGLFCKLELYPRFPSEMVAELA
ncbi:MAG: DNA polymerase III subunit gamma/tau, partial [Planctomycetota bacterium]|nr:DNA polymerase III subunit gamma/tau [Planctomycetota bacterium]